MTKLSQLVEELSPDLETEARDFIEFLLSKRVRKSGYKLRQDWGGDCAIFASNIRHLSFRKNRFNGEEKYG